MALEKRRKLFTHLFLELQAQSNSIKSNVILFFILTPFLTLPSPLKVQNFTTLNETLMSLCADLTYVIERIQANGLL